jgi:hypothetical protein
MNDYSTFPKASKPPPRKKPKPAPKPVVKDPVHVAAGSFRYRFLCDGTDIALIEGTSPQGLTEAQLRELIRYKHLREVT